MNKRQHKKYIKKLCCKTYYDMRRTIIYNTATKHIHSNSDNNGFNMIYVIDSKRMDLKHPKKVTLLCNCIPKSMT